MQNPEKPIEFKFSFTAKSANAKTDACILKNNGCYAEVGHLRYHWDNVDKKGLNFSDFLDKIKTLPTGQLWRHNVAGDLPGNNNKIDWQMLRELVIANKGKQGFTYTHYPLLGFSLIAAHNRAHVRIANNQGFTINSSANSVAEADDLYNLGFPTVCIIAIDAPNTMKTPGRNTIVKCPAVYREDITCASCALCQKANRKVIIGFPAHGVSKKKVQKITGNFKGIDIVKSEEQSNA